MFRLKMTAKAKKQITNTIARLPEHLKYEPRVLRDIEIYFVYKNKEATRRELAIKHGVTQQAIDLCRVRYESKIKPALKEVLE